MTRNYIPFNQRALEILWRIVTTNHTVRSMQYFREGLLFNTVLQFTRGLDESVEPEVTLFLKQACMWLDAFEMFPISYEKNRFGFIVPIIPDFYSGRFVWELTETDRVHVVWARNVDFTSDKRFLPVFVSTPPSMSDTTGVLSRIRAIYDDYLIHESAKRVYLVSMHRRANPTGFLTMDAHTTRTLQGSEVNTTGLQNDLARNYAEEYQLATRTMLGQLDRIRVAEEMLERWDERNERPEQTIHGFSVIDNTRNNIEAHVAPNIQPLPGGWHLTPAHEPRDPDVDKNDKIWRGVVENVFSFPVDQNGNRTTSIAQYTVQKISNEIQRIQKQLNDALRFFCTHTPNAFETAMPVTTLAQYHRALQIEADARPNIDETVRAIMAQIQKEPGYSDVNVDDLLMRVRQFVKISLPEMQVVMVKWKKFDPKELMDEKEPKKPAAKKGKSSKKPKSKKTAQKKGKSSETSKTSKTKKSTESKK